MNFSRRVVGRQYSYLLVILPLPGFLPSGSGIDQSFRAVTQIPVSLLHLILTLLGLTIIICYIIFVFSRKLKKVNKVLQLKNEEIGKANQALENGKNELSLQKEEIAKELDDSEKFFGILIQSADDGISFFDSNWNMSFSNNAFYSIIGFDKESYNTLDPVTFIHPDDINFSAEKTEALKGKGFFERELRLRHKDGHYVNLSTRSVLIKDNNGEIMGSLTISRDITSLKRVHEELFKAKVEAEASNKLKASFLANISHEIRTPLNSVIGFSNLLLEDNLTKEVKADYVEHINFNSDKLLQIIGDIIDLARLESSQMEISYEETSVSTVVNEVINETRQSIKRNEKPIILSYKNQFEDNVDLIFTDRIWLKRVLKHLLDNAVKFTLEGSVELSYLRENDNILFIIKDTGIGINTENLVRIFDEFSQESNGHQRPFEGLGVGLTLAREVLARMGGKIYVKSEKGIGSEFSFTIPYRPAGNSKVKAKKPAANDNHPDWSLKKCLLVDDNKDVLIYLNRILLDTGINLLTARSGPEAISIVKRTADLDVVLLDMQMPEMNGIETTREIRKIRKDLPIIAQTAFVYEGDKDITLEAGCDACLIKPIRKEHLLNVMSGFIKTS